jgi:ribose-phosphate pyrophosphokinase
MSIKTWKYPGGEIGVRVENTLPTIPTFRIQNSDDLIAMIMALNCAMYRNESITEITIPYLPYARQDRVATVGDPNAIQVVAELIATTNVRKVYTYDVHSEKSVMAFAEVGIDLISKQPTDFIKKFAVDINEKSIYLISPDKGATEKTKNYLRRLEDTAGGDIFDGIIQCAKVRDPISGKLKRFEVEDKTELPITDATSFLIVDDICDGGRTFLGVYDALVEAYGVHHTYLWTTHGIYSQGIDILATKFRMVASTDTFINGIIHPNLITYNI